MQILAFLPLSERPFSFNKARSFSTVIFCISGARVFEVSAGVETKFNTSLSVNDNAHEFILQKISSSNKDIKNKKIWTKSREYLQ